MSDDSERPRSDDTDPFEEGVDDADPFEGAVDDTDPFEEGVDDTDPFEEGVDDAGPFEGDGTDPFAELETDSTVDPEVFERMEIDEIDDDDVWDALDADLDTELPPGPSAGAATIGEAATDHIVDKRTYCQRCPYFADPPETACTHDGTAIVESIGFAEFRVRNCPMVADEGPQFDQKE